MPWWSADAIFQYDCFFYISQDEKMVPQTIDTLFLKPTLTSFVLALKTFSCLFHFYFSAKKYISAFIVFVSVFMDFCFIFQLDSLLQVFSYREI